MKTSIKNFNAFKSLGSFFLSDIDKKRLDIEKKVDQLIEGKLFDILSEYRASGYVLTYKQKNNLIDTMLDLHPGAMVKQLNRDLIKGIHISDKELIHYFRAFSSINYVTDISDDEYASHNSTYDSSKKTIKLYEITKLYKDKIKDSAFTYQLMQAWDKKFQHYMNHKIVPKKSVLNRYNYDDKDDKFVKENLLSPIMKYHKEILSHKSIEQLHRIKKQLNKVRKNANTISGAVSDYYYVASAIKEILNKVDSVIQYSFEKDLSITKQNIQLIYVDNQMDELIIKESMKMIEKTNIKDLPKIASDLLFDIKSHYISLYKKIDYLNQEEQFTLQNLWEKRVPEIISKYLHIDKEDRLTMFNRNNQNAEQLMIASLENINSNFILMKKNKNEEGLTSLSATHKYTQQVKKN